MAKRKVIQKIRTSVVVFTDETVKTNIVVRDSTGTILNKKEIVQQNKLTRVPKKDRKMVNSKVTREYIYEDGYKLTQVQEFRYTPKRQDKKLEREFVITEG